MGARVLGSLLVLEILAGCGLLEPAAPTPVVDLTARVSHRMTVRQVEEVVLSQVAVMAPDDATAVIPAQVTKITLLRPGQSYPVGDGVEFSDADAVSWAVEWRGTVRSCDVMGRDCHLFSAGAFLVRDGGGVIQASYTP